MTEFLSVLLTISLYSAVIFGAIMAFRGLFRGRCSAGLLAALWLLFILRLAVPYTMPTSFRLLPEQATAPVPAPAEIPKAHVDNQSAHHENETGTRPGAQTQQTMVAPMPRNPSAAPVTSEKPIPWFQIAFAVYVSGAVVCGVRKAMLGHLLRKQLRHACPASVEAHQTARRIARKLNVRLPRKILSVPSLTTPALTVSVRPALLLPPALGRGSASEHLEYALMHELMHLRRLDHLVALAMQILETLYWFNPAVWIGFREARSDMEDACDAAVAANLGHEDRAAYAHMLVRMAAAGEYAGTLGMAASRPARQLARRVRQIFEPCHTHGHMWTAVVLLIATLAVSCFTTACQPTPQVQAINAKNPEQQAGYLAQSGSGDAQSASGQCWTETLDYAPDGCTVEINAMVEDHGAQQVPVLALERRFFTDEDVKQITRNLFGDLPLYRPETTRSEIEAEILAQRRSLAQSEQRDEEAWSKMQEDLTQDGADETELEEARRSWEAQNEQIRQSNEAVIAELEAQYEQAASGEEDLVRIQPALEEVDTDAWTAEIMAFPDGEAARLDLGIDRRSGEEGAKLEYRTDTGTTWVSTQYEEVRPAFVQSTEAYEADLKAADGFVRALGVDYMDLFWVSSGVTELGNQQHAFTFTRKAGAYPEFADTGMYDGAASDTDDSSARQTAQLWGQECVRVYVQDGEVVCGDWDNPATAQLENTNASVISFDQAADIARQRLEQRFAVRPEDVAEQDAMVHVTGAELGLAKVRTSERGDWKLVPAWSFTGYRDRDLYNNPEYPGQLTTILLVNAVDGSSIDGKLMY